MENAKPDIVIEAGKTFRLPNFRDAWEYRDMFFFLVLRTFKGQYAQSAIGIGWAIIRPLFAVLLFSIIFGKVAKIDSEGAPYPLFVFAGLVPWEYFNASVTSSSASLVTAADLFTKVYFPRFIIPLVPIVVNLFNFTVSFLMLLILMLFYGTYPNWTLVFCPLLVLIIILTSAGIGFWLSSLSIQYRDVKHGMQFLIRMLMYATPVIYPTSAISAMFSGRLGFDPALLYALNPLVGVIEGFRAILLGTQNMPWGQIAVSGIAALLLCASGLLYFQYSEKIFADVV